MFCISEDMFVCIATICHADVQVHTYAIELYLISVCTLLI